MVRDTEFELFLNSTGIPQEYIDDIVNINIENCRSLYAGRLSNFIKLFEIHKHFETMKINNTQGKCDINILKEEILSLENSLQNLKPFNEYYN